MLLAWLRFGRVPAPKTAAEPDSGESNQNVNVRQDSQRMRNAEALRSADRLTPRFDLRRIGSSRVQSRIFDGRRTRRGRFLRRRFLGEDPRRRTIVAIRLLSLNLSQLVTIIVCYAATDNGRSDSPPPRCTFCSFRACERNF